MDAKWLLAGTLPTLALSVTLNLVLAKALLSLLNRDAAESPRLAPPLFRPSPKAPERRKPISHDDETLWRREQKERSSDRIGAGIP